MENENDRPLSKLLREWQVPGAPRSLEERVLGRRQPWWRFLLIGSIRVPVPVGIVVTVVLIVLAVFSARRPQIHVPTAPPAAINLKDFQPVENAHVRIIRSVYGNQ